MKFTWPECLVKLFEQEMKKKLKNNYAIIIFDLSNDPRSILILIDPSYCANEILETKMPDVCVNSSLQTQVWVKTLEIFAAHPILQ